MLTNRTSGSWKAVRLAVVKSEYRVPIPMTTSASRAIALAAVVPVEPIAPRHCGWSNRSVPLPAWLWPTGMPVASQNAARASVAPA